MICYNCKNEIHSGAKFCSHCGMDIKKSEREEIKYLYHKLAHKFHPDKTNGNEEMMKKINKAYADGDLETLRMFNQDENVEDIKEPVFEDQMEDKTEPVKKSNNNILFAGLIILALIIISLASSPFSDDPIQDPLATPTKTVSESKPKLSTLLKLPETSDWSCGDIVAYSGQNYNTVQIGSQCWFKENLNVGVRISGASNASKNGTIEKYCYDNNDIKCLFDGGLYQWDEAMAYSNVEGAQGICPDGWHIPRDLEWYVLEKWFATDSCLSVRSGLGYGCDPAGTKLQKGGSSKFDSVFVGSRLINGSFNSRGETTAFWSSSGSGTSAWGRYLGLMYATVGRGPFNKALGLSARCLKN